MIKGILIYNVSNKSNKFYDNYMMYVNAANYYNVDLELITNEDIYMDMRILSNVDFVIYMDKDMYLASLIKDLNIKMYNDSDSIRICDSKILTYKALLDKGIDMPKTIVSPKLYKTFKEDIRFIEYVEKSLNYPMIIKEAKGSFGAQVYLVNNRQELIDTRSNFIDKDHLFQEFISESYGQDLRIYVVGNKVVASTKRINKYSFKANASSGGIMTKYEPSYEYNDLAIKASTLLGLDFSGVDILFGKNNKPILCEVNSNAHIKNIYDYLNIDVAKDIIQYILEDIKK